MSKLIIIKLDKHDYKKLPEDEIVYLVSDAQSEKVKELIRNLFKGKTSGLKR